MNIHSLVTTTFLAAFVLGITALPHAAFAAGPAPVDLLSSGNFVILSQTGITNTGSHATRITGNIGSSPITAAAMDNVFCSELTGTIYGTDAAYVGSGSQTCFAGNPPLANKTLVDNAVLDMGTAYTDAAGRTLPTATELGAGNIGGMVLAPGLYKWSTGVTIPTDLTLSGGANDVWIFQIAGDLSIASGGSVPAGTKVVLTGGAQASNIFWQVGGASGATLGTYATFNGTILSAKQVIIQTGAVLNGRAFAQTQVTLDANTVSVPLAPPIVPTATSTLTIIKNTIGGNATFNFTSDHDIAPFSITTSNGTGTVTLSNLSAGTYHMSETALAGWTQTSNGCASILLGAGSSTSCTIVNTASTTATTTPGQGEIRGTKYEDGKNDWKRHSWDAKHRGLSGWTIYLDTNNNAALDGGEVSTTTNGRGDYRFIGLTPGTYHVREVPQSGWVQVAPIASQYLVVLTSGQISKNNDFVNGRLGSISGMKYEDKNGNGYKNWGEGGLSGWTIVLKKSNATIATSTTAANGSYSFTNLIPGVYRLSEVLQPGWRQTTCPGTVQIRSGTVSTKNDFGNTKQKSGRGSGHR